MFETRAWMKRRVLVESSSALPGYDGVLRELSLLIDSARRAAARSVNALMTATYFLVGRAIVEEEQRGAKRAAYGEQLLARLAVDLGSQFGRGFSVDNLESMRRLYLTYSTAIPETLSRKSRSTKSETLSRISTGAKSETASGESELAQLARRRPRLSRFRQWSLPL